MLAFSQIVEEDTGSGFSRHSSNAVIIKKKKSNTFYHNKKGFLAKLTRADCGLTRLLSVITIGWIALLCYAAEVASCLLLFRCLILSSFRAFA